MRTFCGFIITVSPIYTLSSVIICVTLIGAAIHWLSIAPDHMQGSKGVEPIPASTGQMWGIPVSTGLMDS